MVLRTFGISIGSGAAQVDLGAFDSAFIARDGVVSSGDNYAIRGSGTGQIVYVQGSVTGWQGGINLAGTDGRVVIDPGGLVGIFSGLGYAIGIGNSGGSVDNKGTVFAASYGISMLNGPGTFNDVVNSGLVDAGFIAIGHGGFGTLRTVNTGTIKSAGNAYFDIDGGIDVITNNGTMVGVVELFIDNDFYNGTAGHLSGQLRAGGGNDRAIGGVDNETFLGGSGNDNLSGNGGADNLQGETGIDTLDGGSGNDTLAGGSEADSLAGGIGTDGLSGNGGNDFFVFNAPLSSANRDLVTDFHNLAGDNDQFRLENAVMPKLGAGVHALNPAFLRLGPTALDANDYVIYNRGNGALFYDSNGNAAGGMVQLATLANKPVLTVADFFVI